MNEKHYKENLSAFVNHELGTDERQLIGEHLLVCAECRGEHDRIKFGAALASRLKSSDAPENLWSKIENALDEREEKVSRVPNLAFFKRRGLAAASVSFGILVLFVVIFYSNLFIRNEAETVKNEIVNKSVNVEMPQIVSTPNEITSIQSSNSPIQTTETNTVIQNRSNTNSKTQEQPRIADSNVKIRPKPILRAENFPIQTDSNSWNVETLAGTPKIGNSVKNEKLAIGDFLETDANSRARVQVANIGNVEIAPNSRVKLVNTKSTEHRLSLERGELKAKIFAPPRLFIVDTPSAAAVDLGCEYTLEVDENGGSKLHVTGGFVALEKDGRESIVPAGAIALTKKGKKIGTPFAEDSSAEFQAALYKFDFENGGNAALETIIKESNLYDSLTLWHLLSRVPKNERAQVFDALANYVKTPANITREGILRLNKKMLDAWWKEVENVWFE